MNAGCFCPTITCAFNPYCFIHGKFQLSRSEAWKTPELSTYEPSSALIVREYVFWIPLISAAVDCNPPLDSG
jgi:hypothetical protein